MDEWPTDGAHGNGQELNLDSVEWWWGGDPKSEPPWLPTAVPNARNTNMSSYSRPKSKPTSSGTSCFINGTSSGNVLLGILSCVE